MYNLRKYNEARALAPLNDPFLSDSVNAQDALYNASDISQGFVWRLDDETGGTGSVRPLENKQILLGLSVWRDVPSLKEFVYGKEHASLIRRRRTWLEAHNSANYVLWWKRASELPTVAEGQQRLSQPRLNGTTLHIFDFKGNDVLGKPKHEQKKSSEQQVMAQSRRRYFVALLFANIFITSITTLFINYKNRLTRDGNRVHLSSNIIIWITVFTAIVSAIGTSSTIILAWRSDKRDAREKELKIAQLERELAASSERRTLPASEENRQ